MKGTHWTSQAASLSTPVQMYPRYRILLEHLFSFYTETFWKCKDYVHCKQREFCKEVSILKGYGTKKCVSKDEPIKTSGWRITVIYT